MGMLGVADAVAAADIHTSMASANAAAATRVASLVITSHLLDECFEHARSRRRSPSARRPGEGSKANRHRAGTPPSDLRPPDVARVPEPAVVGRPPRAGAGVTRYRWDRLGGRRQGMNVVMMPA